MYVINIKHFMPLDPEIKLPPEVKKQLDYYGAIVLAATSTENTVFISNIPCRKCSKEYLEIKKEETSLHRIFWSCSHCTDEGVLSNWEETEFDRSKC